METIFSNWSGNADNSYFSIPAIIARSSEYITSEASLNELEEILSQYYIPAFTITVTPNSICIGVFPLTGSEKTVSLDRRAGASPQVVDGAPSSNSEINPGLYEKISPVGLIKEVKVSPELHTDTILKRPIGDMSLDEDKDNNAWNTTHSYSPIESLMLTQMPSTQSWENEKNVLMASKANLQVINNIVSDQIKSLDIDTQQKIISDYQKYQQVIISISELLTVLSENQKEFTDLLQIQTLISSYLGFSTSSPDDDTQFKNLSIDALLESIRSSVVKDDFPFSNTSNDPAENTPSWYTHDDDSIEVLRNLNVFDSQTPGLPLLKASAFQAVFTDITSTNSLANSALQLPTTHEETLYRRFAQKYYQAGNFNNKRLELETQAFPKLNNSTIEEWYSVEMDAFLSGKESPGVGDDWATQFDAIAKPIVDTLNIEIASGSSLLVRDSISRAISNLIDSGLDISTYLGEDENNETRLKKAFSSSQETKLGIKSAGIYPNPPKEQIEAEDYSPPAALEDRKYLDFATLIRLLYKLNPANSMSSSDLPEGWWEDDEVIDWIYKDILNRGNLSEMSTSNVYSLADSVDLISASKSAFKTENFGYGVIRDADLGILDSGDWQFNGSGLYDARSILGINWFKQTEDSRIPSLSNITSGEIEVLHGQTVIRGPLNFLHVTDQSIVAESQFSSLSTDTTVVDEFDVFGTDSYFQLNKFNSRVVSRKWKSGDAETPEYQHFKAWFSDIFSSVTGNGGANLQFDEAKFDEEIVNIETVRTGIFGGHLRIPNEDNLCTVINTLQYFGESFQNFPVFLSWNGDNSLSDKTGSGPDEWADGYDNEHWRKAASNQFGKNPGFIFTHSGEYSIEGSLSSFEDSNLHNTGYVAPFQWKIIYKGELGYASSRWTKDPLTRDNDSYTVDTPIWNSWFMSKGGGLLRYLGALEGIFKGLYKETLADLQNRLNSITNTSTTVDINDFIDNEEFIKDWIRNLFHHIDFLYENLDSSPETWDVSVNHDGRIVLSDILQSGPDGVGWLDYSEKRRRNSNITKDHKNLANAYIKFKSIISDSPSIGVSNTPYKNINPSSFLPKQIRNDSINSNYVNNKGDARLYMTVRSEMQTRDALLFTSEELTGFSAISASISTPGGIVYDTSYQAWMQNFSSFLQIRNLVEKIVKPVEKLVYFLDSIEISDDQKRPYEEGLITVNDISKSKQILDSIDGNQLKYSADENGISNFWRSISNENYMNAIISSIQEDEDNVTIAFVGIRENFIQDTASTDTKYFMDLDYITDGWHLVDQDDYGIHVVEENGVLVRAGIKLHKGNISFCDKEKALITPQGGTMANYQNAFISWAMNVKGYNLDESVFTDNSDQLYSDILINNDANIFPWKKSDFEKNRAIENVESLYNVSPWLFPQNYLMDILKAKEFKYVIPLIVTKPTNSANSLDGFQGNIKFKIVTAKDSSTLWGS